MRIGVDIDDVIVNTSNGFKEKINEFDLLDDVIQRIKNSMSDIMASNIPEDLKPVLLPIFKIVNKNYKIMPNAQEVLSKLSKNNKIIIITGRGNKFIENAENDTIEYLNKHHIPFDEIYFNAYDKKEICLNNKIDLFIDDSIKHVKSVQSAGIKSILFTSNINKDQETSVKRVSSWTELEELFKKDYKNTETIN